MVVCNKIINPKDRGCFKNTKINEKDHLIIVKNNKISGNSLLKY